MLALIEVALVLGGRAAVVAWAVAAVAYLPTELPGSGRTGRSRGRRPAWSWR